MGLTKEHVRVVKVELSRWQWSESGSTFPRPGGDWTGALETP